MPDPPFDTRLVPADSAGIDEGARLIRGGLPVAVPTETVYGLAADATDGEAVARIYAAKGRPSFNPLIVHLPDLAAAERIGRFDDEVRALAARHWPGPLTIVLPLREDAGISALVTAGLDTIALRVPRHPAMQGLLRAAGRPLAAPSANASGRISPTRADHVLDSLSGRIPLILDAGPTEQGLESTIVMAAGEGRFRVLRPGPVVDPSFDHEPADGAIIAPGQLASHYAPHKPLRLGVTAPADGEWLIGFGGVQGDATLSATGDLVEAAARLFESLHDADRGPHPAIAVAPVPEEGLGIAINDRLRRAAAPRSP